MKLLTRTPSSVEDRDAYAIQCCQTSRELEDAGQLDDAQKVLVDFWPRVGEEPDLSGLNDYSSAEILLRAGVLTARIGSTRQLEGALEKGKDLITRSLARFEELQNPTKVAECQIGLARCYRHEGQANEVRTVIHTVLMTLSEGEAELKARALLVLMMSESESRQYHEALRIHIQYESIFIACQNHTIKGSYYNEFGLVLKEIGLIEKKEEYIDQALEKMAMASSHFEKAGHIRYSATVENNIGNLLRQVGQYSKAQYHLNRARRQADSIKDRHLVGFIEETRASTFLDEGKLDEAEKAIRASLHAIQFGGESILLSESLTTQGKIFARLGKYGDAVRSFHRAIDASTLVEDKESAGRAWLTMLEELPSFLPDEHKLEAFNEASCLLADSQDSTISRKILTCARYLIRTMGAKKKQTVTERWKGFSLPAALLEHEAHYIKQAMIDAGGNVMQAAKLLGISHQLLFTKLDKKHGDLKVLQAKTMKTSVIKAAPFNGGSVSLMPNTLRLRLIPGIAADDLLTTHLITSLELQDFGAYPNDLVVVKVGEVQDGDLAGAFIDGDSYHVGRVQIQGADIKIDGEAVEVEGKVIGYCKADEVKEHRDAIRRKDADHKLTIHPI